LKRLTLLVGANREIRHVPYPIPDPVASVEEALVLLDRQGPRRPRASLVGLTPRAGSRKRAG